MRTRFFLLALAALTILLLPRSTALAHSRLDTADPAPNAVVPTAPAELRIWMTQELTLSGNNLAVTDANGLRVDNNDAHVDQTDPDRKQLVVTLQPLAEGTYTVTYTASSAEDGHAYTDTYTFSVGPAAEQPAAAPDSAPADAPAPAGEACPARLAA